MSPRYKLSFKYEELGRTPLWPMNEAAYRDFDIGPVALEKLPLSKETIKRAKALSAWYDQSLNPDYPPDYPLYPDYPLHPSLWRQEECDRFNQAVKELYEAIEIELGEDFGLLWQQVELREDPDLDAYLKDPKNFKRKRRRAKKSKDLPSTDLVEEVKRYGELLRGSKFTAVNRHPLADETDVLERLGMTPNECDYCELFWAFEDDIYLIWVFASTDKEQEPYFNYFIFRPGETHNHRFNVRTWETPLYTSTIENILDFIALWITENKEFLAKNRKKKGKKWSRTIYTDIGKAHK